MDLVKIRKNIDNVDREILSLINKRMELAVRIGKLKTEVTDPKRESEVLEHVARNSKGLVSANFSGEIFRTVMAEGRRLQESKPFLVGFQGEHGAFSEIATQQYRKDAVALPYQAFSDVFEGVSREILDLGIVPIENSLGGSVAQVNDLLLETDLHIVGEVVLPVRQCLLSLPETDYRDIRAVYSHPQALAQCKGFIQRNKLEARPYYDTAGSAMMLARDRPVATAVIASSLCAEIYNLEIVKENIEDDSNNITRFVVISKTPSDYGKGNKSTIAFSTSHRPGALLSILQLFSEAAVNLLRIESRPAPQNAGDFAFLIDFEGCAMDSKVAVALEKVQKDSKTYKLLGCY